MSTNKNIQEPEVNVGEALSKTEKFFETYKKHIIYGSIGIVAVVVVVGAVVGIVLGKKKK